MIKRTIEISRDAAHLTVKQRQFLIMRDGETIGTIPCEDIGVVLVDHPGTTYTHAALASLADSDAVLVVCGRDHLPTALLLPLSDHSQIVWRINDQLSVSKPRRKQLWKQLVQAKIRAQAYSLAADCPARSKLLKMMKQVRSGDPNNMESQAARVYWLNYLPQGPFRRDTGSGSINLSLNYGYAVVRAAVARALVAAGLMPSIGLHHSSRGNVFCLADDLMEPLRPLVDVRVRELHGSGCEELNRQTKAELLKLLAEPVATKGETGPLMVNLHRMVASLVRCYQGESKNLEIPTAIAVQESCAEVDEYNYGETGEE